MGTGRRSIIYLSFLLAGAGFFLPGLFAQKVRIGLFDDQVIHTFVFHCIGGAYQAFGDSVFSREIKSGELVYISMMGDKLVLMDGDLHFGTFNSLEIRDTEANSSFRLKVVDPVMEPRNYPGRLEISRFHGSMQLINELSLDDYLAGVVEAEGGTAAPDEFYKSQAILCRSYTIKNWEKHPGQNFNLCDNTHCQVFHGMSDENPGIHDAVLGTHGLVLVDQNSLVVSAIFHSNSGGETQRATDVWNSGDNYLEAVLDPFSEGLHSARWEKVISREEWKQYLSRHTKTDISRLTGEQLLIHQDHRKKFFILGSDSIRLADIRTDLALRSTFFTMEAKNDTILIHGKGYGHGVGLSQEGAMEMARQGYSYSDILRFYFYNVQIVELADVPVSGLPEGFR
jgi:stage II sporulation protein D